jgi:hypothetical protein
MASKTKFFFYFGGGDKDSEVTINHKKYSKITTRVDNVIEFISYSSWGLPTTFEIKNNSSKSIFFIGVNFFVEGISTKKQMLQIISKKLNGKYIADISKLTALNPGEELILRCRGSIINCSQL